MLYYWLKLTNIHLHTPIHMNIHIQTVTYTHSLTHTQILSHTHNQQKQDQELYLNPYNYTTPIVIYTTQNLHENQHTPVYTHTYQ